MYYINADISEVHMVRHTSECCGVVCVYVYVCYISMEHLFQSASALARLPSEFSTETIVRNSHQPPPHLTPTETFGAHTHTFN